MVVIRKERVTHENLPLVRSAVYVPDQCAKIKVGDVVTVAEIDGDEGLITVFHGEGVAMKWDRENIGNVTENPPSKTGVWIDATQALIMDDGKMFDLGGNPIR